MASGAWTLLFFAVTNYSIGFIPVMGFDYGTGVGVGAGAGVSIFSGAFAATSVVATFYSGGLGAGVGSLIGAGVGAGCCFGASFFV